MADDEIGATFAALAHPTRRDIIARLASAPTSVGELAEPYEVSLPAISGHLRILEQAGLLRVEKDRQFRRCHLETEPFDEAIRWMFQCVPFRDARRQAPDRRLQGRTREEEQH